MNPESRTRDRLLQLTVIFDLDDTLIDAYRGAPDLWREIVANHGSWEAPEDREGVVRAIQEAAGLHWSTPRKRVRPWPSMEVGRRGIVCNAFTEMGLTDTSLAEHLADQFSQRRDEDMRLEHEAEDVLAALRNAGVRLGLLTNGSVHSQWAKIDRFGLKNSFDVIQVEEEAGVGKPHADAFKKVLGAIGSSPDDAWMVGDNVSADIGGAVGIGMRAMWFNPHDLPLPDDLPAQPDRIIQRLRAVLDVLETPPK